MQDYFKYDKIQTGASLFMKSDSDGSKDKQDKGLPLGIKTTAEGIKHFNQWDSIANSIDKNKGLRFDDLQPNSINFNMSHRKANPWVDDVYFIPLASEYNITSYFDVDVNLPFSILGIDNPESFNFERWESKIDFKDKWDVSDINIIDDIAFVSSENYTDIHRKTINLSDATCRQYFDVKEVATESYGGGYTYGISGQMFSSITIKTSLLPKGNATSIKYGQNAVFLGADAINIAYSNKFLLDSKFQSYDNCILKVKFSASSLTDNKPLTLYFTYGGPSKFAGKREAFGPFSFYNVGIYKAIAVSGLDYRRALFEEYYNSDFKTGLPFDTRTSETEYDYYPQGTDPVIYEYKVTMSGDTIFLNGEEAPDINTHTTATIRFDVSDSSNSGNTILLKRYAATGDSTDFYEVTRFGTPGESGAYIDIKIKLISSFNMQYTANSFDSGSVGNINIYAVLYGHNNFYDLDDGIWAGEFQCFYGKPLGPIINDMDILAYDWDGEYIEYEDGTNSTYFNLSVFNLDVLNFPNDISIEELLQQGYADDFFKVAEYDWLGSLEKWGQCYKNIQIEEVELIKMQPVRKCGKVDIYTRKNGIITNAVNNRFTSPGHSLETNDIIKISSALFDGSQSGAVDIHPLNGEKFVKKIDDDTFDLYDDQFFEKPVSTNNLKTTDGIVWACISSSNGQFGQSWDYHKTLFSPTGRNGYVSKVDSDPDFGTPYVDSFTANTSTFTTNKRIKSVKIPEEKSNANNFGHNVNLDFQFFEDEEVSDQNKTAYLHEILDNIPETDLGDRSFFDLSVKGPQDFYPYHCKDDSETDNPDFGPYAGCKFGSALDVEFSHMSGDSKVYTVAIGERGSDISVDLFGVAANETRHNNADRSISLWRGIDIGKFLNFELDSEEWRLNGGYIVDGIKEDGWGFDNKIIPVLPKNVMPYWFPHGKIHLINITVDKYGRISDISHKNTVFGDGSSCKTPKNALWNNPGIFKSVFTDKNKAYINGAVTLNYAFSEFDDTFLEQSDITSAELIETRSPSDNEIITRNGLNSYHERCASAHWFGPNLYDYFSNTTTRDITVDRNFTNTSSSSGQNKSRFGTTGFGSDVVLYPRIDRFNEGDGSDYSQFFIFPWVDSFGKGVAIGKHNGQMKVFGSSSAFSKNNTSLTVSNNLLPTYYQSFSGDTTAKIGQICGFTFDTTTAAITDFEEIDGGGEISNVNGTRIGGAAAGQTSQHRVSEVYNSLHLSGTKLIFKDGYLLWAEHAIGNSQSTINILRYDDYALLKIPKAFISSREEGYIGDGFGFDIRFNDGLLVTNCLTNLNDFGRTVATYDNLRLYKFNNQLFNVDFMQNISPSFDSSDIERYDQKLLVDYKNYLLDIDNITYEGDAYRSRTWNVRLVGRYDIVDNKILLRDPIEFSLFGVNLDIDNITRSITAAPSSSTFELLKYFYFTEHFHNNSVYYDYSNKDVFKVQDTNLWQLIGSSIQNVENLVSTPVFFLDIPSTNIDNFGNLYVDINVSSAGHNFLSTITSNLLSSTTITDSASRVLPRLILYGKDPRSTIIPNGPYVNSSTTTQPQYTDGLYSNQPLVLSTSTTNYNVPATKPQLFRGGANDLYFYGALAGTSPTYTGVNSPDLLANGIGHFYGGSKNLGELFDLTFNQAGNTNRGIPSWSTIDGKTPTSMLSNIIPYAALISGPELIAANTYRFTIPYQSWKNYLIRGSLIKSSSDNRPMFDVFTRIKHGTLTNDNPFSGNWTESYDDANQQTYSPRQTSENGDIIDVPPSLTLPIGFVLTSNTNVDLVNNTVLTSTFGSTAGQNFRSTNNNKNHYSRILFDSNNNFISNDFRTIINDVTATIDTSSIISKRYKNIYHKIAYFEYNNEVYSDVQKNIIDINTSAVDKYAFGKYSFSPFPVGVVANLTSDSDSKTPGYTDKFKGQAYNSIIRAGTSSASAHNTGGNNGTFAKSKQILTSDNIVGYGSYNNIVSNYYFDSEEDRLYYTAPPTGIALGPASFSANNMIGSFDIASPDYLSLNIFAVPAENNDTNLITIGSQSENENTTINIVGTRGYFNTAPLCVGFLSENKDLTLNIKPPNYDNFMSLWIYEIQPSAQAPLIIDAPTIDSSLKLNFGQSTTGVAPLIIVGPKQETQQSALNVDGRANYASDSLLFISGVGKQNQNTTMQIYGVAFDDQTATLHVGHIKHQDDTTLYVDPHLDNNNDISLSMVRPIASHNDNTTLHIGTQYDFIDTNTTLNIDTVKPQDNSAPLNIEGFVKTANSITHGEGSYTIPRSLSVVDISQVSELPVELDFNGSKTKSNSITKRVFGNSSVYSGKTIAINSNSFFGSRSRITPSNPASLTELSSDQNTNTKAFYQDENTDFSAKNKIIKREAYDANGRFFVVANNNFINSISLDIYNIIDSDKVEFYSKIKIDLGSDIPFSEDDDSSYVANGSPQSPYGDSFVGLRRKIRDYFISSFDSPSIETSEVYLSINDVKLSNLGRVAVSFRAFLNYTDNFGSFVEKTFNVIIIFKIEDVKFGSSFVISREVTNYIDNYNYYILEEDVSSIPVQNKTSSGYSISFGGEDLYFDRRSISMGQIWKLSFLDNYSSAQRVIDFSSSPDASRYFSINNSQYISNQNKKAAFGLPIKIYDEYNSDGKIMFVGAQLFDPYLFNDLSSPHVPNPIGAVYIYKQQANSSSWSYFGAVYGKGYTSENVLSNLSQYRNSLSANKQYCLFGYDFDYSKGNLVVSEPGGDGPNRTNTPRAYLFAINDSITLLKTYLASDVLMPDSSSLLSFNNFGSNIILLNGDNPITYSDSGYGNGLLHSLKSNKTIPSSLAYVSNNSNQNIKNETYLYGNPEILNYTESLINRSSVVNSIKILNFGQNKNKIGILRRFTTGLTAPANLSYQFELDKLFIYDLAQPAFSLFISGPNIQDSSITAQVSAAGQQNNNINLVLPSLAAEDNTTTLFLSQKEAASDIPLILKNATTQTTTLSVSGVAISVDSSANLFITASPENNMPLTVGTFGSDSIFQTLYLQGTTEGGYVETASLYIGRPIDSNAVTSIYIQAESAVELGYTRNISFRNLSIAGKIGTDVDNQRTLYTEGPSSAITETGISLHTISPIPEAGIDPESFVNSGSFSTFVFGSNDGSVFSELDKRAPLYMFSAAEISSSPTLYIDIPSSNFMTLSIKDQNPNISTTVFVSGANIQSSSINLSISPPQAIVSDLFVRGYLE